MEVTSVISLLIRISLNAMRGGLQRVTDSRGVFDRVPIQVPIQVPIWVSGLDMADASQFAHREARHTRPPPRGTGEKSRLNRDLINRDLNRDLKKISLICNALTP